MTTPRVFLLSLHPRWATLILDGAKTIEVRRRFSPSQPLPADALIYASGAIKAVVGTVRLTGSTPLSRDMLCAHRDTTCIPDADLDAYLGDRPGAVAITLAHPRRLHQPIPLADLRRLYGAQAPQSYAYAPPALWAAAQV